MWKTLAATGRGGGPIGGALRWRRGKSWRRGGQAAGVQRVCGRLRGPGPHGLDAGRTRRPGARGRTRRTVSCGRAVTGGKGGNGNAGHSKKGTEANRAAEAARRASRRDAERKGVRDVVDAGRAHKTYALPARQHLRAIAALAKAGIRRILGEEAAAGVEGGFARGGFRDGVGIPAQARNPQEAWPCARAPGPRPTGAGTCRLLIFKDVGWVEQWASQAGGGAVPVRPELAFDVCWVGRAYGRTSRQRTVQK